MNPTLHAPVYALHAPVYTLRIQLDGIEPPIWRRIEVPASFTLRKLHDVIQITMGWSNSHLHLFEIGALRYGFGDNEWDDEERDDSTVLLGDVVDKVDAQFRYEYDFGDDWTHSVHVEAIRRDVPRTDVPRLLAGARACPPEDCGGVRGYFALLGRVHDPEEYDVVRYDRRLAHLRRIGTAPAARRKAARSESGRVTRGASTRSRSGRGARRASPVALRLMELTALLDEFRREVPSLPARIGNTAEGLLRRFAGSEPDTLLGVRKPEVWVAAALHASFMLHPYWKQYPRKPMTLADLSGLWGVSSASISKRSRQLRRGVRLNSLVP